MSVPRLNLAGRLASSFITSKLTIVFIVGVLMAGVFAVALTPREENPQIVVPGAVVTVALPGASAREVDQLIVGPLEGILSEMSGVDHTYGVARNSLGAVQVQFKVGESPEDSLVKLYNRVMANRERLPAGAGIPTIRAVDADDVPVVTVTLASNAYDDYGLKRVADRMAERLRSLPDVSVVSVRGGRDREIGVAFDPERLVAFSIALPQAYAAITANNLSTPLSGPLRNGKVETVQLRGAFSSVDDVRDLVVGVHAGRPVYVRDVAIVTDGPPIEITAQSRFAFGSADARAQHAGTGEMPAVTIAVAKKKGANAVLVSRSVVDRIDRMQQSFVPKGIHVVVTRDDGKKADAAVNVLIEHLAIALFTVSLIMVLFLGWREALIVTLTVPLIFSITLAADYFGGVTINRVTLFALILALGLLVDAAIVVIENIHRHYNSASSLTKQQATILATNEIGDATNLATLAVMLVFGSLFLVTGMAGDYFYPVAYNVPIAMAGSIVVAYIVTPWAANRWLRRHPAADHDEPDDGHGHGRRDWMQRLYLRLIGPLQFSRRARRGLALAIFALILASSLQGAWQFIRPSGVSGAVSPLGVALGFMPKDNKNTFNIVISMAETTPVEETDRMVREIGRLLSTNPNVSNYQSWIGQSGVVDFNGLLQGTADRRGGNVAEIRVNLVDKHARRLSSIEIVRAMRPKVDEIRASYPGARVRLVEDPPGPPVRATVLAEIYGPESEGLRRLSTKVETEFARTFDMVDISNTEPVDVVEQVLVPDREKAALSGVSVAQIAELLRLVYGGDLVGRAHPADERNPVDIRAYVPRRHAVDPTKLDGLFVNNTSGQPVALSELVKVSSSTADRPIQRKDNERVAFVGGELSQSVPLYAVLDLNRRLSGINGPDGQPLTTGNLSFNPRAPDTIDGYQLLWDGEMRMTLDIYRDMIVALGVALTAVYLLLVAYYRSFLIPMIAMSSVPLGIIGIFPGHWILGVDFSATSIVGIIALSGVVIRNSLLIIDFIEENLKQGMALDEAVRMAGAVRLRPIILTTLAIVLGSAIMVSDPVFGGLAISLIFGTLVSTALTVFVVPILYQLSATRGPKGAAIGE